MVRFDASTHSYYLEEVKLISVTQLLKKHSITPDFSHVNREILDAKAERGTMIHQEIENLIKNRVMGFTNECMWFFDHVLMSGNAFHNTEAEVILYNDKLAGTADVITYDKNNELWIIDTKTGQVHKDAVRWQLSLYKYLYLGMNQYNGKVHLAVFDAKENDADCKFYEVEEIAEDNIKELLKCEFEDDIYGVSAIEPSLVEKALQFERLVTSLEEQKKQAEADFKAFKEQIKEAMKKGGVKNFTTDKVSITLKDAYTRTSVDSKKLQESYPDIYKDVIKTSNVSESILITVKEIA